MNINTDKIEIGGGNHPIHPEWPQMDIRKISKDTYQKDARVLPFQSNQLSTICSCYLLPCFTKNDATVALKEWLRCLKPGGKLELYIPDLKEAFKSFLGTVANEEVLKEVYGSQDCEVNYFKHGYDFKTIDMLLSDVGFVRVTKDNKKIHHEYSMTIEAYKSPQNPSEPIKLSPTDISINTKNKIIFLTEDTSCFTGGRYYSWWLATALKAAGHDVVIYTNRMPLFIKEFKDCPKPEVEIVTDLKNIDVEGSIYIGSPVIGSLRACQLGIKYNKPVFVEIFDPFPMMAKYRGRASYPFWDLIIPLMRKNDINIISLCNTASAYIYDWLNKRKDQVFEIYPCVNSIERDKSPKQEKENWVTFISRLDNHKKLDHVLDAIKDTDCNLHIITSIDGINFPQMLRDKNMVNRVVIHKSVSDEEKFRIIKKSRATINGAIFEGFGMWLTEALSCGVPTVCYNYPTFREIAAFTEPENRNVYFAKYNNPEDLKAKLKLALKENKITKGTKKFDFPVMVKRMKEIFKPRIGVVTIALNEKDYIGASLRSMMSHPIINKIAVVEGCVTLNKAQANEKGLSKDSTNEEITKVMKDDSEKKITYKKHGWANNKSELRNIALDLLGENIDYVLVVDADEVWKKEDLDKLTAFIENNPDVSVIWFNPYHFWKQPDLIAVGSAWDIRLFRFFKYDDKTLRWKEHDSPVRNKVGELSTKLGKEITTKDIHFYHYGAMKPENRIKAKLEFYRTRDINLTVKNTWSNWKKGQETQWTNQGGTAIKFKGTHPPEIKKLLKTRGNPADD